MSTIDRLRELEQAATPGPWLWDDDPDLTQDSVWAADGDCVASTYGSAAKGSTDAADAALIAESRNALPALLAVAEAARVARDWLESRPDFTEGDAATSSSLRAALARLDP